MHVKRLPWQGFPGIFSSIDRYTKQVILSHLEREGRLPRWMEGMGHAVAHIDPPHWSRFRADDATTGVTLRGEADAVFILDDGSCAIVDYKTSRYNPDNRSQLRVYRAQLNAYAWIAARLDFPPVSRLALAYMEPATGDEAAAAPEAVDETGFTLAFHPPPGRSRPRPRTPHSAATAPGSEHPCPRLAAGGPQRLPRLRRAGGPAGRAGPVAGRRTRCSRIKSQYRTAG